MLIKNHYQANIQALESLGGEGTIQQVNEWIELKYIGTNMADMVPKVVGGNNSSLVVKEYQVLERVARGKYRIIR